ncbi:MAG: hypothetical protein IK097_07910, partial [Clostridia bacterium]|nr:hypothetical protein [Clostridia bacterium]
KKAGETIERLIEAVEEAGEDTVYEEEENGEVFAQIDRNKYLNSNLCKTNTYFIILVCQTCM